MENSQHQPLAFTHSHTKVKKACAHACVQHTRTHKKDSVKQCEDQSCTVVEFEGRRMHKTHSKGCGQPLVVRKGEGADEPLEFPEGTQSYLHLHFSLAGSEYWTNN